MSQNVLIKILQIHDGVLNWTKMPHQNLHFSPLINNFCFMEKYWSSLKSRKLPFVEYRITVHRGKKGGGGGGGGGGPKGMQWPKIMHFSWIYILTGYFFCFFRKVAKKCRPYLATFLEKNANLLGVFLKQYKNCRFLKTIFWYVLINLKVSETSRTGGFASLKNALVRKMARIGSGRARMVFKKSKWVRI